MEGEVIFSPLNVNGLHDNIKRKCLKMLLRNTKPDIALLQETHINQNSNTILRDRTFPYQWHSNGSSKDRGTAILINCLVNFQEIAILRDSEGRYIAVRGLLNGEAVTIASVYAPNTDQVTFVEQALQKITEFGDGTMVIAGD